MVREINLSGNFHWSLISLEVFQKNLREHTLQKDHYYFDIGTVVELEDKKYIVIGFLPYVTYLISEEEYKQVVKPKTYFVDTYELSEESVVVEIKSYLVKLLFFEDYAGLRKLAKTKEELKEREYEFDQKSLKLFQSYYEYKW